MKRTYLKKTCIQLTGLAAGGLSFFGYYPLGVAYFAAAYTTRISRFLLFPVILISMAFTSDILAIGKYGLSMVVMIVILSLLEDREKKSGVWIGAVAIGVSVLAMETVSWALLQNPNQIFLLGICEGSLVFSLTIILAKILEWFVRDRKKKIVPAQDAIVPGREKMKGFARSFQNLAETVQHLPVRKEEFTRQDMEGMFQEVSGKLCKSCRQCDQCWKKNFYDTYKKTYQIFHDIEANGEEFSFAVEKEFSDYCIQAKQFLGETRQVFQRAKLNLLWNNRMLESREAVADQLSEMARIMVDVADDVYDMKETDQTLESRLGKRLKSLGLNVKQVNVVEKRDKRQEIYINVRAKKKRCVSVREISALISKVAEKSMVPQKDSRNLVKGEYCTLVFVEDTNFQVLYGVARMTRDDERISGDNFSFTHVNNEQLVISLSDGMGSGVKACQESEMIIELLEQFLEAGFCKETAVRMINSALIIQSDAQVFTTIDISTIDLFSGVCEFLKIGASTTFIKRDHWVEVISSTSLPAGVFHKLDYDSISKKLYHGDFVIMVTDGVLDALPIDNQEAIIRDIIMRIDTNNPKDIADQVIEQVLAYSEQKVPDDMTVIAAGIWNK